MFFVILLHCDFVALGYITNLEVLQNPLASVVKLLIESFGIVAVNVFVFISGWFSIKASIKGIIKFLFHCAFFVWGIYILLYFLGLQPLNKDLLLETIFFTNGWFIFAYILLYVISPILNIFSLKSKRHTFKMIIVALFTFQTIFDFMLDIFSIYNGGYSTISFINIYLLARYINIYKPKFSRFNRKTDLCIYVFISLFIVLFSLIVPFFCVTIPSIRNNDYLISGILRRMYWLDSPFVIVSAVFLFLYFYKLNIQSKVINWVASSCFSVYLLHDTNSYITNNLQKFLQQLYISLPIYGYWLRVLFYIIIYHLRCCYSN